MDNPLEAGSPPPAQLTEAPRQLPSLPEEIILHIIKLAYPPLSLTQGQHRRRFLHGILTLNKSWYRLAKGELYTHLWPERDEATAELLRVHAREGRQLSSLSVTVTQHGLTSGAMRKLLKVAPELRSFCYMSRRRSDARVNLELLAELIPNIEEIVLCTLEILEPGTPTLSFPKLRRLALRHLSDYPVDPIDFPALALDAPKLKSLMLRFPWREIDAGMLEQGLETVAGHLKTFSIGSEQMDYSGNPFSPSLWSSLVHLETLILDDECYLADALPHLVSPLQRLIIRTRPDRSLGFVALLAALQSSAPCLASLKELQLPVIHPKCVPCRIDEMTGKRSAVTNWCAERGIQVITAPFYHNRDDFLGYFEDVLDV